MTSARSLAALMAAPAVLFAVLAPTTARAALEPHAPKHLAVAHERLALDGAVLPPGLVLTATDNDQGVSEVPRFILAYIGGVGLQILGVALSVIPLVFAISDGTLSASTAPGAAIAGLVLLTLGAPALSSLAVWAIVSSSPHQEASYLLTWLGGVIGTVAVIPFGFIDGSANWAWVPLILLPPLSETIFAGITATPKAPRPGNIYRASTSSRAEPIAVLARGEQPRPLVAMSAPLFSVPFP